MLEFKEKALNWASTISNTICFLDSNDYQQDPYSSYDFLLAVDSIAEIKIELVQGAYKSLNDFKNKYKQHWLFGFLSYELKDNIDKLHSNNPAKIKVPYLHFFVPKHLIYKSNNSALHIQSSTYSKAEILAQIQATPTIGESVCSQLPIKAAIPREQYINTIQKLKKHILDGDIYEINFCQEFWTKTNQLLPLPLFKRLNNIASAPFSAYYKMEDIHLLCSSPERYICKRGNKLISQPIKGTRKRGTTTREDKLLAEELLHNEKDRAENVMIVDLVRNDLSLSAIPGTVEVEELFGIYHFEKVIQMISTVTAQLSPETCVTDILQNSFPMGSMTGAPKHICMQLINQYEQCQRGLYSGAVGYFSPNGDFDFNVVIRSLVYDHEQAYLSFQVGGAIVYDSNPEDEYEECLTKAKGILEALRSDIQT